MLLALETATEFGGVALLEEGALVGEASGAGDRSHAAWLLEETQRLLAERSAGIADVRTIAVSIGPGSFTGLRVGLATALGLCFGSEREIVPVPTLAALSQRARVAQSDPEARIVPLLDARRGQLYTGVYGPGARPLAPDRVADPLRFLRELGDEGRAWFLGPGAWLYRNEIVSVLGSQATILPQEEGEPRASEVGTLGFRLLQEGAACSPSELRLRYLRLAEAEEKRLDTVRKNP